eukprot:Blabericola_migrator_1__2373@NODE_1665_length_4054_cov_138_103085_g1082_i0_p2_GENE_NODE_1665_length_4054_cov_138_103085_g1082_i0NODE_1665_length_4054_cov_138_103085_g1082_i0_p2_ORF_typecomplete_len227_score42_41Kdo/PF06293_14/2e36RIO1/PF01163_22/1e17Pkinase/PF00069_25/2_6e13Pkinase_Tyr/PF07714_17/2_5e09WaaY/PF06176_11/3_9e08APH/PF01636_23/9_9e08Pkinase_fungal/PF17667_1/1_1e05EcKinase/PF02958_20/3_2e05Choline_kinase/PF01633_20/0_00059Choline_kinase/PF01633_20/7_1e02Fructosamin_kin/PF03881_14/4_5e
MASVLTDPQVLFQGAESKVYSGTFLGLDAVCKERFSKKYRHPALDEQLTKTRVRAEVRNLQKCKVAGIDCPAVLAVRPTQGVVCLERIKGDTLASYLRRRAVGKLTESEESLFSELPTKLGVLLSKLHEAKIVHGDLTTCNIMLREGTDSIVLIDFGLAQTTEDLEDRAVDLYVFERAMESTHAECAAEFNKKVFKAYADQTRKSAETIKRLDAVRARGRKKLVFG